MIDVCNCVEFYAKKSPERDRERKWKEKEGTERQRQRD